MRLVASWRTRRRLIGFTRQGRLLLRFVPTRPRGSNAVPHSQPLIPPAGEKSKTPPRPGRVVGVQPRGTFEIPASRPPVGPLTKRWRLLTAAGSASRDGLDDADSCFFFSICKGHGSLQTSSAPPWSRYNAETPQPDCAQLRHSLHPVTLRLRHCDCARRQPSSTNGQHRRHLLLRLQLSIALRAMSFIQGPQLVGAYSLTSGEVNSTAGDPWRIPRPPHDRGGSSRLAKRT